MSKYKNLIVWQEANELAIRVYKLTSDFPREETFGLITQLTRAALSVPTNKVEGYGRKSKAELSRFIDIARGSLAETEYLIEFSKEFGYIKKDITEIQHLIEEIGKLLWNFQKKSLTTALQFCCSTALLFRQVILTMQCIVIKFK